MHVNAFNALSRCPICRTNKSHSRGCCTPCYQALFRPIVRSQTITLGTYEGQLEQAIRAYKFHNATRLAKLFAAELAQHIQQNDWQIDAVCAVPLHTFRFLQRGYNQAAVLAKEVAGQLGKPFVPALIRVRRTRQQAKLNRAERIENVSSAFKLNVSSETLRGKQILLIDDVITSGATTAACQDVLLTAGAASVKLAAIARAQLNR